MGAAVTDRWSIKSTPAMDAEQFQLWQALLEERTGMTLSQPARSRCREAFGEVAGWIDLHLALQPLRANNGAHHQPVFGVWHAVLGCSADNDARSDLNQ